MRCARRLSPPTNCSTPCESASSVGTEDTPRRRYPNAKGTSGRDWMIFKLSDYPGSAKPFDRPHQRFRPHELSGRAPCRLHQAEPISTKERRARQPCPLHGQLGKGRAALCNLGLNTAMTCDDRLEIRLPSCDKARIAEQAVADSLSVSDFVRRAVGAAASSTASREHSRAGRNRSSAAAAQTRSRLGGQNRKPKGRRPPLALRCELCHSSAIGILGNRGRVMAVFKPRLHRGGAPLALLSVQRTWLARVFFPSLKLVQPDASDKGRVRTIRGAESVGAVC